MPGAGAGTHRARRSGKGFDRVEARADQRIQRIFYTATAVAAERLLRLNQA
jgi:hypothetical protein